jgi:hypothetical protein
VVASSVAGVAVLAHPRAWLERRRARVQADYWIRHGFEARYRWRVAELTSSRERRACARALDGVRAELMGSKLPGAAPLRSAALRPHVQQLTLITARLREERPVSAVGMLAVADLLTSPGSCLFAPAEDVETRLAAVLVKLDAS